MLEARLSYRTVHKFLNIFIKLDFQYFTKENGRSENLDCKVF